jgi:Flp pilus assembly protein TadD
MLQESLKKFESSPDGTTDKHKMDPSMSCALLDWGFSFLESGRFDEAFSALVGIAKLNPEDPLPWAGATLAAALAGDSQKAQACYLELIARNPNRRLVRWLQPFVG